MNPDDFNFLCVTVEGEKYIFFFTDDNRQEVVKSVARFASNPELNFTWVAACKVYASLKRIAPPEAKAVDAVFAEPSPNFLVWLKDRFFAGRAG